MTKLLKSISLLICTAPLMASKTDPFYYPPQSYQLQCNFGLFLSIDFLYWFAKESDLVWATKTTVKRFDDIKGAATPIRHLHFDTKWGPGIRIGIGKNFTCDGWDLLLNWLYLHNTSNDAAHFSWEGNPIPDIGQMALYNPWAYGSWYTESFWQTGISIWQLNFDLMHFELGRKFWLSPCFTLRPFGGLTGTWLHTRYRVRTSSTTPGFTPLVPNEFAPSFQMNRNFIRNTYWGVGLLAGLQPSWAICNTLSIFGSCSGSLVWGRFFGSNVVKARFRGTVLFPNIGEIPKEFSLKNHEKEGFHRMQPMLDLALGLHWEDHWCSHRFSTSVDLSWEYHYWPNFGLRHQTTGAIHDALNTYYTTDSELKTDLSLGGLVVRGRIDF